MSIPTELKAVEAKLKGSRWRRRIGRHKNEPCTLVDYNGVCAIIERDKRGRGWERHTAERDRKANVPWDMLLRLYVPVEENFMSDFAGIKVDQNYTVVEASKELQAPTNKILPQLRPCNDVNHKGDHMVDVARFDYDTRKGMSGRLRTICRDCAKKRREYDQNRKEKESRKVISKLVEPGIPYFDDEGMKTLPNPLVPQAEKLNLNSSYGKAATQSQPLYRWAITVVKPVIITVEAANFLDAAIQVENEGEIVRMEKL